MSDAVEHAGFDDWLDALEAGEGSFLACHEGHGSLPPRRVCPTCGATDLRREPLPESGTIETLTITHVPTPSFEDDAPYVTAIADFGAVRLTGQVTASECPGEETDVDGLEALDVGTVVEPIVATTETTGDRVLRFRPR